MTEDRELQEFDKKLLERNVEGLWHGLTEVDVVGKDPRTSVVPYLWKWQDLYGDLQMVAEMHGLEGQAERRLLCLVNPGLKDLKMKRQRGTTQTMQTTMQMLKPGEKARSHRHNFAAFRFIIQGHGAYTVVEGEKIEMEKGDLILTPPNTWHGHVNETEPMVWMDGLDNILINSLQVISWEPYPGDFQTIKKPSDYTGYKVGLARPVWEKSSNLINYNCPLAYKWKDTYPTLKNLMDTPASPFDGVALEYVNPMTGGHTFPTLSCWIQAFRPGEVTKTHRHNSSVVYHVFEGSGTTVINGEKFSWEKGDCFVVPLWSWHSHQNRSKEKEAILFSVNDMPLMEALKLYREEPGEGA